MAAAILAGTESVPCCMRVISVITMPPNNDSAIVSADSGAVA